jgi:hypothetical protein
MFAGEKLISRMDKIDAIPFDTLPHSITAPAPLSFPYFFQDVHKFIRGDTHEVSVYYFLSDICRLSGAANGVVTG